MQQGCGGLEEMGKRKGSLPGRNVLGESQSSVAAAQSTVSHEQRPKVGA